LVMDDEILKPSTLIHIAHNISLLQAQLWDFIFFRTPIEKIIDEQEHQLPISEIINFLGNTRNRKHVQALLEEMAKIFSYAILKKSGQDWGCFPLFSSACVDGGIFKYSYPLVIKKAFASYGPYSTMKLSMLRKFDCKYALFLYPLCFDYKNTLQTPWFTLQQFYQYMGIQDGSYSDVGALNYHVVRKAVAEVNKKSDLMIKPKYQIVNRKTTEIKFAVLVKEGIAKAKLAHAISIF
jgi:plasmid replication initiation protein